MGVTYVCEWKPQEGKTVQESSEKYSALLEMLGAEKTGTFTLECESFHNPTATNSKTLHMISCSDYPASRFVQFEPDGPAIITDAKMSQFLKRLSLVWQAKKGGKLEVKGQSYRFEDYHMKLGVVTHSTSSIAITFEVEYSPCMYATKDCWSVISNILQTTMKEQAPTMQPLNWANNWTEGYTYEITANQYLQLFIKIRQTAR